MRVHVFSDLHLEFGDCAFAPEIRDGRLADLVLLAGDIHTHGRGPAWAAATFDAPVAMVLGNHEAYGDSLDAALAGQRAHSAALATRRNHAVRTLERETLALTSPDGTPVRIVAATLWTDYALFGAAQRERMIASAHHAMNDFQVIRIGDGGDGGHRPLTPSDCLRLHDESRAFLEAELAQPFAGVSIVMTHHAPSGRSLPPRRLGDPLSAAYASDLEALIEATRPQLWVHGHIHSSSDYRIGATRVVCNPRGYFPHQLNPGFDPALAIEVAG